MATSITIDPAKTVVRTRLVNGLPRRCTYVLATCSCNTRWYIRADAAKNTQSCFQCSQRRKAVLGYNATAAKYGERFALRWWREWRIENPTNLEQIVTTWLNALDVSYEREYWLEMGDGGVCLVDFMVEGGMLAIEANGTYWHEMPGAAARDARKAEALRYSGIPLLTLSENDLFNGHGYGQIQALLALHLPS